MSVNQEKFSNLNKERKDTHRQIRGYISSLNALTDAAMKQQSYMHKDPDENGANELIELSTPEFLETAASFNEVANKLMDMQAVQSKSMSVDDFISKYSINLSEFSAELI